MRRRAIEAQPVTELMSHFDEERAMPEDDEDEA